MAQTKSRSKNASTRRGANARSKSTNSKSTKSTNSKSSSARSTARSTANSSRSRSSNGFSRSTVAKVAEKAKLPVIAGGAALAGVAGAVAYNRNNHKKRGVFGRVKSATPNVKLPKPDEAVKAVGKAAGTVAERSRQVGEVASRVQKASKTIDKG